MKLITHNSSLITKKGFTLVEILVAITIMIIVVAAVYTSFRGGTTAWTKGTARMERFLNARAALDMMSREISAALIAASGLYVIDFVHPTAAGPLRFAAPMDGHAGRWDMVEIAYRYDSGDREIERALDVNPAFLQRPLSFMPLVSNMNSLRFEFWDATASPPDWRLNWDSRTAAEGGGIEATRNRLPQAVRITIIAEDAQRRERQTFSTIVYLPTSR